MRPESSRSILTYGSRSKSLRPKSPTGEGSKRRSRSSRREMRFGARGRVLEEKCLKGASDEDDLYDGLRWEHVRRGLSADLPQAGRRSGSRPAPAESPDCADQDVGHYGLDEEPPGLPDGPWDGPAALERTPGLGEQFDGRRSGGGPEDLIGGFQPVDDDPERADQREQLDLDDRSPLQHHARSFEDSRRARGAGCGSFRRDQPGCDRGGR